MNAPLVRSLEARYYTDPAIFEVEMNGLLARTWQFAGHASQIEGPGDYFAFEIAGESLFCIRGRDGDIRVFLQCLPAPGASTGVRDRQHPRRRLPLSRVDL